MNADDVAVGSKGYFSDTLASLETAIIDEQNNNYGEIEKINGSDIEHRFGSKSGSAFSLFYLVEGPKEKKLRPYKDTDEMVKDFIKKYSCYSNLEANENPMYFPAIWLESQITCNKYLVTRISNNNTVTLNYEESPFTISLKTLLNEYTYLNGSPCGIEE